MQYKIQYLPIGQLVLNPENPRLIRDAGFRRLVKSLKDCPELFDARPCICSNRTGKNVIMGGNMRYLAAKELKYKDVPAIIMSGLTEDQEREIVIKDNGETFGEWNMDLLSSSWDDLPLVDWGVNLPEHYQCDVLDLSNKEGENKQTTYDKLADKKGGVLFNFGDIQQSIPIEIYECFKSKINTEKVKESLIKELSK